MPDCGCVHLPMTGPLLPAFSATQTKLAAPVVVVRSAPAAVGTHRARKGDTASRVAVHTFRGDNPRRFGAFFDRSVAAAGKTPWPAPPDHGIVRPVEGFRTATGHTDEEPRESPRLPHSAQSDAFCADHRGVRIEARQPA